MTSTFRRAHLLAVAVAAVVGTAIAAPTTASAAPQQDPMARSWEALPPPTAPQVPGYQITGYNVGKGNYRGAIDPQTGSLWLTNVSPLEGASESSILKVDPNTMRLLKRIRITRKADTGGHGTIAGAYEIGIPKTGDTLWTTGAPSNEVNVWNKNTGKLLKTFTGISHAHGIVFAEGIGVAIVTTARPGGLMFFDMRTLQPLGQAVIPGGGKQMGTGIAITDDTAAGATVTTPSYYTSLTQFRITRPGGAAVHASVRWNATLDDTQGHGSIAVDVRTNRVYVNDLYKGYVSVHNLRTGAHIANVLSGPGANSLLIFGGEVYVANYFGGYISVIDQRTLGVSRLLTTGLLPNQLLAWKRDTFLVIDKSSAALDGGYKLNRGTDRVWKVRSVG
ncbi:hypothetical protein HH308_22245 [Gordonia sp. TBRC 11910]|uniref:Sugar lactone lactonase YvrE n=1 Tax=Gordonia asplenii TaxID=2725283 RepID=A0A848KZU7_9ACTN|nr:hypothetical protein [Gordonia asplenii]NMO03939.1 hypothetical protein [Gordonia asplenii]